MKTLKRAFEFFILAVFLSMIINFMFSGFNFNRTYFLGYKFASIQTNSMEPTLMIGDSVVIKYVRPSLVKKGDMLAYEYELENGKKVVIIHRVYEVINDGFITKGDNNDIPDTWTVKNNQVIGIVKFKLGD